jgi:tripartite-type tricarboxylate transporter receptor subunit TctC
MAVIRALLVLMLVATPARAQDAISNFYRGKTLTMLIGAPAGGGYDLYARMVARHIGKHVPGAPNVISTNMVGAGGNLMVEYLNAVAPRDGTVMGSVAPGVFLEPLIGDRTKVKFDPPKLNFIGSANKEIYVCFVRSDAAAKSFADVFTQEVIVGATAEGGSTRDMPVLLNNVLGAKFRVVSGYAGTRNIVMAIEKGEVQGQCGTGWSSINTLHADWFRDGHARVLAYEGPNTSDDLLAMKVPSTLDFVRTDEQRQILDLVYSQTTFGRPFMMAPEVPPARVEALRSAFDATMRDAAFLEESAKIKLDIRPLSGIEVQGLIGKVFSTPPEVAEKAKRAMIAR